MKGFCKSVYPFRLGLMSKLEQSVKMRKYYKILKNALKNGFDFEEVLRKRGGESEVKRGKLYLSAYKCMLATKGKVLTYVSPEKSIEAEM